jgi:hypothetical protein
MILKKIKFCLPLLLVILVLLQGCASTIEFRRGNIYESRDFACYQAIRWGEFEKAQTFINMREGKPKALNLEFLKQIRVTKLRKINEEKTQVDEDEIVSEITSNYEIEYYFVSNNLIKTLRYQQVWWFDKETDIWFLDSNLPDFGG